jgi:hydrogenase maturation protease
VIGLVIALGQSLRRDDGAAAILVDGVPLPDGCTLRVLPQLLPELVDDLARVSRVLFVDAAVDRCEPTLEPIPSGSDSSRSQSTGFSHFASPCGLLELCHSLHGIRPIAHALRLPAFDLGFGEGLSPSLQAHIPEARRLLEQWLTSPEYDAGTDIRQTSLKAD